MPHSTKSLARMQNGIDALEPFDCENLRGTVAYARMGLGIMRGDDRPKFVRLLAERRIDYVIFSYDTPIAWHYCDLEDQSSHWEVTTEVYSVTTTNHKRAVRTAIENPGYYVNLHEHVAGTGVR